MKVVGKTSYDCPPLPFNKSPKKQYKQGKLGELEEK